MKFFALVSIVLMTYVVVIHVGANVCDVALQCSQQPELTVCVAYGDCFFEEYNKCIPETIKKCTFLKYKQMIHSSCSAANIAPENLCDKALCNFGQCLNDGPIGCYYNGECYFDANICKTNVLKMCQKVHFELADDGEKSCAELNLPSEQICRIPAETED